MPRDHWLLDDEKLTSIAFHDKFPLERLPPADVMMIDQNLVAASPSSVYRILAGAGLVDRREEARQEAT